MPDLKSPALIYLKAALFLVAGCTAAGLLVAETPTLKVLLLLAIAVWGFCRAYYFAFYVIEKYLDPGYKFAGLSSLVGYWASRRAASKNSGKPHC